MSYIIHKKYDNVKSRKTNHIYAEVSVLASDMPSLSRHCLVFLDDMSGLRSLQRKKGVSAAMPARPNSNATLIRDGYARATRTFPYSRQREFLQLEAQARTVALDARDQKMIAIEARLRQTMLDLIGDPDGIPDEPPSRKDTTADSE